MGVGRRGMSHVAGLLGKKKLSEGYTIEPLYSGP